jgi:flagellar biosynthesis protein FlhG
VGGGKGGIGKSMVSANLGIALAQAGNRVLMVDADLGGANLHTCLGVPQPQTSLSDFLAQPSMKLEDVAIPTGVENLSLIAGALDALDAANPRQQQKLRLLRHLQGSAADYLLLDLGAGTSFHVLDFFLIADHCLLVLLPEPTSVENAYRFIKASFFRRLQNIQDQYGIGDLVDAAMTTREGAAKTPYEFIARVKQKDRKVGAELEQELAKFKIKLVVNQARTPADLDVGNAVVSAWKKFFGLEMDYLGAIRYDDEVWRSVRKRRPVLLEKPESEAASGVKQVADRLLTIDGRQTSVK